MSGREPLFAPEPTVEMPLSELKELRSSLRLIDLDLKQLPTWAGRERFRLLISHHKQKLDTLLKAATGEETGT